MMDFIHIGLAFLEGLALIASPCILPILPILLSGSLDSGKKRPLGIILGFIVTFTLFTFFAKALVVLTGINLNVLRYVSYALLILFGIVMLSNYLSEKFSFITRGLERTGSSIAILNNPNAGFKSGILLGSLIGLIWTPCAGPILAAVIVQTVLQQTNFNSFLVVLFFGIGAAIPMLMIALFGRSIMTRFSFFKTHANAFRKTLGAIIIISVLFLIIDENKSFAENNSAMESSTQVSSWFSEPYPAPEIAGISSWINSVPLDIKQLKGKVVLIDFWAYSCINCIRTLPHLKDWYQKYHDKGLVIIGVHSPEFQFEHDVANVKNAVEKFGIKYPVALDNNFTTWRNYNNQYWPAHYLIDKKGDVIYSHFGEGEYTVTENNIRYLLGLSSLSSGKVSEENVAGNQTPETYLGSSRANTFSSPEAIKLSQQTLYTFPSVLENHHWALNGAWTITPEKIIASQTDASLKIHFNAGKIFIVMGSVSALPVKVKLQLNGEPIINEKGKDVTDSIITVDGHRLYEAVILKQSSNGILQITALSPGLEVYTFTFGS